MDRVIYGLQDTAIATQSAISLLIYMSYIPKVSNNPYIGRLTMLLQEIYKNSMLAMQNYMQSAKEDRLKDNVSIIYESASSVDELHIMLKRTLPVSVPENAKYNLNFHIKHVLKNLTELAPYMANIFGPREVLFVVTPEFQARSGLWK